MVAGERQEKAKKRRKGEDERVRERRQKERLRIWREARHFT